MSPDDPVIKDKGPSSEAELVELIDRIFPTASPFMENGRADDCAFLRTGSSLCVSTDIFLEDVHFRRSYFTPAQIGYKALAVNVSDLAAAGAKPLGFSMGLTLPPDFPLHACGAFLSGMADCATRYGLALTGGDLSRGPGLGVCITVFGEPPFPGAPFLRRTQAKAGHALFLVTGAHGRPGEARTGLLSLEENPGEALKRYPHACEAFLTPVPLVREGMRLGEFASRSPSARLGVMDLSDGLARDVPRLLGPGLAARIELDAELIGKETTAFARSRGIDPAIFAWLGGEDYLLLGSVSQVAAYNLAHALPDIVMIGEVVEGSVSTVNGIPVPGGGHDHFAGDAFPFAATNAAKQQEKLP